MLGALSDLAGGLLRWRTSYNLGLQDIILRYQRSLLGPFWISASLLASVLALAYVFSAVFQQSLSSYIAFLASGLLAWQLILALMTESCASVTEHAAYLQNVRMPISVIAGRIVLRNGLIFLHNAVVILAVLVAFGGQISTNSLMALPGVFLILMFGYFLVMVLGPLCARFRDVPQAVQSVMQVIFFLTPIFWMPSAVEGRAVFTDANPFYHFIELVRAPLLGGAPTLLNWQMARWSCSAVAVAGVVSTAMTRKRLSLWL